MKLTYRVLILIGLATLWFFSAWHLDQLKFQLDFDQYFPENDPSVDQFRDFEKEFGSDDNFFLVAIRRSEGVFDTPFLKEFHAFSKFTNTLDLIVESESLTSLRFPVKTPMMLRYEPFLSYKDPNKYASDAKRIFSNEQLLGNFISRDTTVLVVVMKTKDNITAFESEHLIGEVEERISDYPLLNDYHILGKPFIQISIIEMQKRELTVSMSICFLLMVVIIWIIYQRFWPIVITSVGLGLCIVIFLGFLAIRGEGGDELIALYPVIIIIVGISDVIHIISKYIEELNAGLSRADALKITIREIGFATLITSLTTAAGFASLLVTDVEMVKIFGVNSAIGVMITYVIVMLYLIAILPHFEASDFVGKKRSESDAWQKLLNWICAYCLNRPKKVMMITVITTLVSVIGIMLISTNHKFIFNLPKGKPVTKDFAFFEEELNGFRPLEFVVRSENEMSVADYEFVANLNKLEEYILNNENLSVVNSLPTLSKSIGQNIKGRTNTQKYNFPASKEEYSKLSRFINLKAKKERLINDSLKTTHISGVIKDIGADDIQDFIKETNDWFENQSFSSDMKLFITGTGLLLDKNIEYVRSSILEGLGLAILVVALLLGLIFKNIKMVLVGIVPNLFPLIFTAAIIGFTGIKLELTVGIVFVVAFGIAVDDTIHFLTKYKICRRSLNVDESIRKTIHETGKAIILTSIILFFAFFSLIFSIFPPSTVIGILVSLTLIGAVLSNMFLLPVILRYVERNEK
ncbi:MAG: MMPL family transporter [Reichenbachiella sp.]